MTMPWGGRACRGCPRHRRHWRWGGGRSQKEWGARPPQYFHRGGSHLCSAQQMQVWWQCQKTPPPPLHSQSQSPTSQRGSGPHPGSHLCWRSPTMNSWRRGSYPGLHTRSKSPSPGLPAPPQSSQSMQVQKPAQRRSGRSTARPRG